MKFKIGIYVKCIKKIAQYDVKDLIGKIVCIDYDVELYPYGVEFKKNINSDCNCDGYGRYDYSLWFKKEEIVPINSKQRLK